MRTIDQKKQAKDFAQRWQGKGYEKGESQKFWLDLLEHVLGVGNASEFIHFEDTVKLDKGAGFIDGYIDKTKVMIEQKSINKDLRKPIKQSDGSLLNPFQQAKRYAAELPYDKRPRWIVTSNFQSFLVYDMNNPNGEPEEIQLENLAKEYYRLLFLVDTKSEHIKKEESLSFQAGEIVGELYDAFSREYHDITNPQSQKDLNELCVRLVFCLYAEDAGVLGKKDIFHDYLAKYNDLTLMRKRLIELFAMLDTPYDQRDPYMDEDLAQFPYVNGGLFSNGDIEIPKFTEEIREKLLEKASDDFDWSDISPTIFGAVFESTLNPETRHAGGMHYTSIENIHKVIDPLFLNDLREKLNKAESYKNEKTRNEKLREFQNYIASLTFLDPAAGSGNFLTETYLSLRRLENEAINIMSGGNTMLEIANPIKVSIQQFYGIEINDFAVKVAKTALWIAEAQMWEETRNIIFSNETLVDFLPLETYNNIKDANALRIDWNDVVPNSKCDYIMGNPPFLGGMYMSKEQKAEIKSVFDKLKGIGELDYVTAWYKKALDYIQNTNIRVAFVSTNSICQGSSVITFWKYLFNHFNFSIDFAYQTFVWNSEAKARAKVHCIILGFSNKNDKPKFIYTSTNKFKECKEINAYLNSGKNIFVESRSKPICNGVPSMAFGSMPRDGGGFVFTKEEMNELIKKYPVAKKWIRLYIGANELLKNKERYCLWLVGANPTELKECAPVLERINAVREFRLNSKAAGTRKFAEMPTLFCQIAQPDTDYIMLPKTSSGKRRYIPLDFKKKDIIASDLVFVIPGAKLYEFGMLESNVHMSWVRTVAGRLKSDYRYSKDIVYNNFPWPNPTEKQKLKIEQTAQAILDARALYPDSSLADLYDELTMPIELRKAHQENDKAVMQAYGFDWRTMTESECVGELMKLYQDLVND